MISKSCNSHMNRKLTTRGFQRDQNCQILEICWNKESNETKIKRFGLKITEKSLFQNQWKSKLNLGENEEHFNLKTEIDY